MSLNDYFAANGAVYLRPVGLPDCFPLPGLPHGCKPPPLTMQHPCNTPQKPRTMAAVSPLHQVVPPQPTIPSYDNSNLAFNSASRTSSFAAALRKLAKQAGDPVTGEKDLTQISPVSSPVLSQGSLTPKRSVPNPPPPSMFLTSHQVSYASSSPPVVTIAPSRPVATHTSDSRKVSNSNSLSNGHVQDSMSVKLDPKAGPRNTHSEKWEEATNKGLSGSSNSSQVRPHATIAPLPRPDDSLTSSRGFQPYRGTEESRNTLPHHISLFDHHPAVSYPYTPAFLPPPHLSHPAYRFDDPLYLERYSLLRPPVMPYPQPGMMAPPTAFYPNSRYAADIIAQSLSMNSANNSILNHERLKLEEERRMREKEIELDQSRSKEQERQREKEQKDKETRERDHKEREHREKEKREREKPYRDKEEHSDHKKGLHNSHYGSSASSKRTESPSVRNAPVVHSSSNHTTASSTIVNTTPLNLVVQPGTEPPKKETELWMPWQQPSNSYPKENNHDCGSIQKQQPLRPQEIHRHSHVKENSTSDKVSLRFSPSILNEKKHSSAPNIELPVNDITPKKHFTDSKRQDQGHHYSSENVSGKDHGPYEWRHEKLQKACTNNHRKSHESKKIRDGVVQNHQRKVANGAILKTQPYQNEGMHARLLESEKSRLEMNGHLLPMKTHTPVNNDRLVVPAYKSSQLFSPGKDSFLQSNYPDYYNPPILKSNVEVTPVVSKLDLDAKKLQENGFQYDDDDDCKEEKKLKNFLILTKVPPAKYEHNPQKLRFLRLFGLTTHFKRKKIEFDMYLKRRKILMEDYEVQPLSPEPESNSTNRALVSPVEEIYTRNDRLAEQLISETTPVKLEFLFKVGLTPITLVKKEEKERIRRIVEEEKLRRHYRLLAKVNKKASPRRLFVPKSEAAIRLDHLRKLREMNAIGNGFQSKTSSEEDEEMNDVKPVSSNHLVMPKIEKVPYLCSVETSESSNSPYPSTFGESCETSFSPQHKSFTKYSFKRGHSLKNEFRFLAPEPVCKNNHIAKATYKTNRNSTSVGVQVEPSIFNSNADKTLTELKSSFNWPGLETIMEAFYRHQNEQSSEKTMLTERCKQLRQTQEELKKEADSLSRKMSELLRNKRELDEDRQHHQHLIDNLKQCLRLGR